MTWRLQTFLLLASAAICSAGDPARGERGMVVTGHPLATRAGLEALQSGGNAIDAAVAAALMLGVVDGHNSGIGGGCFLLIRRVDGECVAIDGRETAPAAASPTMFLRDGKADTELSQTGPLAVAVPGALAAYDAAISRYGKKTLREPLLAAANVAEEGFLIDRTYAARLKATAAELARFPSSKAVFLHLADAPLRAAGDRLIQADLAATYRAIAAAGVDWFYRGEFAQRVHDWMAENGGLLKKDDFASYRVTFRDPIRTTYRGFEVVGFPPPSSGGVHVLQLLNMLEQFDLKALGASSADAIHLTTEAMKLAFADRAHWLGDPAFTQVPRGLVAKEYAADLAQRIRMETATAVEMHGTPAEASTDIFKHTTHFCAADAEGNWVSCTATINTSFGSKVTMPGTGVLLNNEMDDFALQPGVANAFGLLGGEANAVAPGKRPLSSMSPTLVLQDGQPVLAVGAAGGPTIISQVLLTLVNFIDFELHLAAALAAPRFHHQWRPDELRIERAVAPGTRAELIRRGHVLSDTDSFGACQALSWRDGFIGVADPRGGGAAAGW